MYYNTENKQTYDSHSDIRKSFKTTLLPRVLSDEILAGLNVYPVKIKNPTTTEYEVVTVSDKPPTSVHGEWSITNTKELLPLKEILAKKLAQVAEKYEATLYSNITAAFPNGTKTVQFRDDRDRTNLANVSAAALALVVANDTSKIKYRTLDNENQVVTPQQMVDIAKGIFLKKQQITERAWAHKDALYRITDIQELINYDTNTGW